MPRINTPVTQREYPVPAGSTLMSTTDPQGVITYANAAFVAASGYAHDELVGQHHNIVRHPDMPVEAFADLWSTLQSGRAWTALVKNRRKDGDHYWVRANVTPVRRGGRLVGYMSVRTVPARDEIEAAERLYAQMRAGRLRGRALRSGLLVRSGWLSWMSAARTLSTRGRVGAAVTASAALGVGASFAAAALGLSPAATGAVAVAVTAVLAALGIDRQITQPLQDVLGQAARVAAGDLAAGPAENRSDEIGLLLRAVRQAGLNLRSLLDDVSLQASGVQAASSEVEQGSMDLSTRTEKTAASLEETAASMEQLNATVKSNADSAGEASRHATTASEVAARSGEVVGRVVGTMEEIAQSSRRIADIIGTIDGIAFQTNILALNAAVEAARAGEQGRGFAVVAGEVRALAQRSAEAAREIKSLIGDSVDKVTSGSTLVAEAGTTIRELVSHVDHVNGLMSRISVATQEQTAGIGQVGIALHELDTSTQQNAALVEQSAAAAGGLNDRARRMAEAIAVYRSPAD